MRALLGEHPEMPATVLAERVEWSGSITWFRENVRRLRPEHRPIDPADRLSWAAGDAAQCDLWFPPAKIPLEHGTAVLLPVLVIVAAHSRFVTAKMIPTRKTEDLLLGSWELIQQLGRVPRRLIWDSEPGIGQKGRLAHGFAALPLIRGTIASEAPLRSPCPCIIRALSDSEIIPRARRGGGRLARFSGSRGDVRHRRSKGCGCLWRKITAVNCYGVNMTFMGSRGVVRAVGVLAAGAALVLVGVAGPAAAAVGAWGPAVTLSDPGQDAYDPRVVTDGSTLTAVWFRSDGSNGRIQSASSTDGGATWSAPVTLSDPGQDAYFPQVVTDGSTLTAAWFRSDGSNDRIQASSYTTAGSPPSALADTGASQTLTLGALGVAGLLLAGGVVLTRVTRREGSSTAA